MVTTPTPESLPEQPTLPPRKKHAAHTRRVFVRLPDCSPFRALHPLHIVKTVNSVLPLGKAVKSAAFVRTGITLHPKTETSVEDLLQHKDKISKALSNGKVEKDEEWSSKSTAWPPE
jgi:hypothetical protein